MENQTGSGQMKDSFCKLGTYLGNFIEADEITRSSAFTLLNKAVSDAERFNPWFTKQNIEQALSSWAKVLKEESLQTWINMYPAILKRRNSPKNIAVIMAGNIPLVGMHDFISTLLCGHFFIGKLSRNDQYLLPAIAGILSTIDPDTENYIQFTHDHLKEYDAVIATGSNNTSRYFEYYFSKVPHIIRNSRNGVAVLSGNETEAELLALGDDICMYFGLGCRSISKIYLPEGFDILRILNGCNPYFDRYIDHHKYMNNYLYQKTIFQMNQIPFYENGSVILINNEGLASPVSVVYYEYYQDKEVLMNKISQKTDRIQCIVSNQNSIGTIPFGKAQYPDLWEYADGVDTIQFLLSLTD